MSGIYSLIQAQNIQYNLDCSGGPGQAQLTVESPVGAGLSYALDGDDFQASTLFSNVFPGNHWLFVQNASGELDSIRFNANCGLEPFACGDCDASDGFYQVFGLEGELAALDLDEQEFKLLPNSPAGYGLNAMGINPLDSLAYGIKRSSPPELIVVDKSGRDISLGNIDMLPNRVYHAGDFDPEGYLHIKDNQTNRQVFMIDVKKGRVERTYNLSSPLYTADFAYNPINGLFYGLNGSGRLYSFDPNSGLYSSIANTSMGGSFGAVYSDNSGIVWGIENATGNLYEVDLSSGDLTLIMTTTNSSRNDGFSCQNSFFSRLGPPDIQQECSDVESRVNIRITEPDGEGLEFKLNNGDFENTRYYENLIPGEYEVIVRSTGGCLPDTASVVLTAKYVNSAEIDATVCDSFIAASGRTWYDSGSYQDTILNSMGCDSIINYEITILESTESMQSVEVCDEYISPTGKQWNETGTFRDTLQNANGCDSILTFDLTIFETFESTQFIEACNEYTTPDGQRWTQSGTFSDTVFNSVGCDSIFTFDITILESSDSALAIEACEEFISPTGERWDQSGTFLDTIVNSQGCDSVITYDITILERSESIQTIEACDEFTSPSGNRWSQTGTFLDTIQNSVGCDSILTYNLTILESSESSQSILSCDPFLWNGILLDSSGTYEHRATNEVGCDSIVQINFTLTPTLDTQISVTSCRPFRSPDGEEIWSETGLYRDTILSSLGCDSIITVNLVIGDVSAEWSLNEPACPDRLVSWLRIDTITHQGPHYLIRNELDTILISSIPIEVNDLPPGEHRIQFVSSDSCESPVSLIQVEGLELPEIRLIGPTEIDICDPPTLYQLETNMPGDYQWYSNSALECDTCSSTEVFSYQEGILGVNFIAENGCTAREEFDLKLNGKDVQYHIPNVFSPNGDGINDYFTLFTGNGEVDQIELFEIYDRWGARLFQRKNFFPSLESLGWDGSYNGQPMSTGVYVYHILYRHCDGSTYRIHGSVTLVR